MWPFRRRRRVLELDRETVRAHLLLFARCGGRPTLEEFAAIPTEMAVLLAEAVEKVHAQRACILARAASGELGYAAVAAVYDDGAQLDEMIFGAALERAVASLGVKTAGERVR